MKVLLYSGGMDSWLIDKIWKPDVKLYIDIHGEYSEAEKSRLPADVQIIDFSVLGQFELANRFVPMRNLYFLMLASHYGNEICLGATAGDWGNNDKTPEFLNNAEAIIQNLWQDKKANKRVSIEKGFVFRSKSNLIDTFLWGGGKVQTLKEETFSCYSPIDGHECLSCYPCFRKFALLYCRGAEYSQEEKERMWAYVKSQIIPTKEQGGYQGTYYTDRGEESEDLIKAVEMLRQEMEGA